MTYRTADGQSLLELIVAVAVGVVTVLAAVTVLSLNLRIGHQDTFYQSAAFLQQKLADDLTVTAERDWQGLALSEENKKYRLAATAAEGVFKIEPGTTVVNLDETDYTTFFTISGVARDSQGSIGSGGDDPSTKKADIFITWVFRGETATSTVSRYLTRSRNLVIQQTDWSGGPLSPDQVFLKPANKFFAASSTIEFSQLIGAVKIRDL